ncbi:MULTISPECIES: hypothetical protein [Bacillus]|uniref:Uncharacterized protein n=3 Tax=Bacillus cereus group TaxID=86661 RepID=A0A9W5K833_BACC8|nr:MULTISPECIES: hypothetical protein [Bacillus]AMR03341.1 hypothetical protein AXW78_14800 [Bacillus thuringiensis]ANP81969.1 hypothetical protein BAQ53_14320 [Bacillus sp. B25(2016b)]AYF83948.1 hypothetical protein D7J84_23495 [Bacillus thuringiensis]EJR22804.1 hypothetical protein IIA_02839 [Bacillus cereus VD014]KAB2389042.1 hypothetical protein F8172_25120 [Bacillus cereus]
MFNRLKCFLLSEKEIVDTVKKYKEEKIHVSIIKDFLGDLILIRTFTFLMFVPISTFIFSVIIYGAVFFLSGIKITVWGITIMLLVPITLLFYMNITNTSIIITDLVRKFLLTIKYLNPFYSIINKPWLFIFELLIGFLYVFLLSLFSIWIVLHSLEIDFSEFSSEDNRSFQFSIIILHTAIYLFIRVHGQYCKTTKQKIKKLKMKFYLWFCSMIASIVYIFESLFNYMNGIQAIYFIFVLMIALERTVTHYKKFIDFLECENLYEKYF